MLQYFIGQVSFLVDENHAVVLDENKEIALFSPVGLNHLDYLFDQMARQLVILCLQVFLGILEETVELLPFLHEKLLFVLAGIVRKNNALLFQIPLQLFELFFTGVLFTLVLVPLAGKLFLGLFAGIGIQEDLLDID